MSTGGVVLSPLAASQQQQQPEPFATSLPLNDVRVGANDWYNVTASIRNAIVAFAEHFGYHARRLERVETTLTDNSKDVDRRLRRIEERVELAASDKSTLGTDGAHRLAAMEERLAFVTEAISQKQAESVRLAMLEERVSRALEVAETASAFASSASTKAEGSRVAALEEVVAVLRERVSHAPIATAPPPTPATPVRVVSDVASHVATLDAADSAMREAQMANARCEQLEEARRREANRLATLSTSVAEMVARVDAADLPSLRADMDAIGANAERAIATAETQLKKAKSSHGSGANPTDIARLGSRVSELEGAQQTQQEELTRRMDDLEPAAAEAIASASRALKANKALESKHSKLVARCESISRELEQTVSRCEAVEQSANDLLGRLSAVESASSSAHEGARGSAQRVQQAEASITKFADRLERIDDRLDQSLSELEGKSVSLSDEVKKCAVASRAASERSSEALSRSESVAAMAGSASALSAIDGRLRELEKKEQREGGNSEAVRLRVKVLEAQMKQAASASSVESLRDYIHEVNIELHGEEFRSSILQKVQPLVSVSDLRQDEEITKMCNELSRVNSKVAHMGGGLHDVSARQEAVVSQLGDQVANLQLQLGKIAAGTESDARQDAAVLKLSHAVSALQAQLGQIADGTAEDERQNATMAQMKQSIAAMQSQLSQASTSSEDARQDAAMAKLSQTVAAMQSQLSQAGASTEDARQDAAMAKLSQTVAAMQSQLSQAGASSEDARQDATMTQMKQSLAALQSELRQIPSYSEMDARQDANIQQLGNAMSLMQSQLGQMASGTETDARQDAAVQQLGRTISGLQSQLAQLNEGTAEDVRQNAAIAKLMQKVHTSSHAQDAAMAKVNSKFAAMQWKQTIKDSKLRSELEKQNVSGAIPELRAAVESIQAQLQTISHPKSTAEREDTHESLRRAELRIIALEKQNASLEENLNSLTRSAASAAALGTVERRVTILEQENSTRLLGDTTNSQTIQHLEGRVAEIEVKSGILSPDVENRLAEAGRLSETIPALTRRIVDCEALKTRISEFERRAASAAALEDLSMRIDHIAQNTASHDSQSQADLRARLAEREVSASAARAADEAAIVELKVRIAGAEAAANASAARAAEASAVSLRSQEIGEQVRLELSASTAYSEQCVAGMLQDVDTLKTVIFGKKSAAVTANFTPSQILQGGPLASLLAASEAAVAHPPGSLAPEPSFSADPNVHAIASMGTPGTEGRHGSRSVIKDVDSLVTQVSELQVLLAESSTDLASMQASVSSTSGDVRHLMSDTYRRVEAHAAAIGTLGKSISRGMETRPTLEKVNAIVDSKLDDRMERVQRRIKSLEGEYDDVRGRILRIGRAFETATSEIEQRLLVMASRQGPSRSSPGSPAAFGRVIQGAVNESRMAREAPTHRQAQPRSPIAESPISQSRKQLSFSEDVSESSFARAGESELRKIKESVRRANTEIQEAEKSLDETVESLAEGVDDGDTTK